MDDGLIIDSVDWSFAIAKFNEMFPFKCGWKFDDYSAAIDQIVAEMLLDEA